MFCDEAIHEDSKVLNVSLGTKCDAWELNSNDSIVNLILWQIHEEFGQHTKDAYEFGHRTIYFPEWINGTEYKYIKQKQYLGNRHDINFENAMLRYPMVEAYTEFLCEYVMSSNDNKLQWCLLIKLQSDEIVGALQA